MMSRVRQVALLSAALFLGALPSAVHATCAINAWGVTAGAVTSVTTTTSANVFAYEYYDTYSSGTGQNNVPTYVPTTGSPTPILDNYGGLTFPAVNVTGPQGCAQCTACQVSNQWLSWESETPTNFFQVVVNGFYYSTKSGGSWQPVPAGTTPKTLLTPFSSVSGAANVWQTKVTLPSDVANIGSSSSSAGAPGGFQLYTADASNKNTPFHTAIGDTRGGTCTNCGLWNILVGSYNGVPIWNCGAGTSNWVMIGDSSYTFGCNQPGYWLVNNHCPAGGKGDPQFAGLRGQDYQVHGIDGGVYNVISDKYMQLNSKFAFLTGPRPCPVMPSTGKKSVACFAHAGSYLGNLALRTSSDERVLIESGKAAAGLASVSVNGEPMKVGEVRALSFGSRNGSVTYLSTHEVVLTAGLFTMEVENSDDFLNLRSVAVPLQDWRELKEEKAHGLLGQTWKVLKGKSAIEGKVDDYLLESEDLFGTDFMYNRFGM